MGIQKLMLNRHLQTLDQLENCVWGPPTFHTHLVITCHRLRTVPIGEFTIEDLRIMIGQDIGSMFLVPLALDVLEKDALAEGNYFRGDLLCSVLHLPATFWFKHTHLRKQLESIVVRMTDIPDLISTQLQEYKKRLG